MSGNSFQYDHVWSKPAQVKSNILELKNALAEVFDKAAKYDQLMDEKYNKILKEKEEAEARKKQVALRNSVIGDFTYTTPKDLLGLPPVGNVSFTSAIGFPLGKVDSRPVFPFVPGFSKV